MTFISASSSGGAVCADTATVRTPLAPSIRRPRALIASTWAAQRTTTRTSLSVLASSHARSQEHKSEPQSLLSISYDVFCLKKKTQYLNTHLNSQNIIKTHTQITKSTQLN